MRKRKAKVERKMKKVEKDKKSRRKISREIKEEQRSKNYRASYHRGVSCAKSVKDISE